LEKSGPPKRTREAGGRRAGVGFRNSRSLMDDEAGREKMAAKILCGWAGSADDGADAGSVCARAAREVPAGAADPFLPEASDDGREAIVGSHYR